MTVKWSTGNSGHYGERQILKENSLKAAMAKEFENSSFFAQLRNLAQKVDSGVKELQSDLSDKKNNSVNNSLTARNLLKDLLKETRSLKEEGLNNVPKFEENGKLFSQKLAACQDFLTTQSRRLTATEDYLEQYGYVRLPDKDVVSQKDDSNDTEVECEDNVEKENLCPDTDSPTDSSDPPDNRRVDLNRTPQLDDFGISSYTMNFIHNLDTKPSVPPQSIISACDAVRTTPSVFDHNGLTLTPSMWGHSVRKTSPDFTEGYRKFHPGSVCGEGLDRKDLVRGQTGVGSGSPAVPVFLMAGANPIDKLQKTSKLPVNSERSKDSPLAPVFMTPGAKQINKTPKPRQLENVKGENIVHSPVAPQFLTPGVKQINKAMKGSEEISVKTETTIKSPDVPVFKMPGAKQIEKSTMGDVTTEQSQAEDVGDVDVRRPVRRRVNTELFKDGGGDDAPRPPRLTMSLQDLTDLTQSFYIKSGCTEPQPPTGGMECRVTPLTPVKPELLSEQLERLGMMPLSGAMPTCPGSAFRPVKSRIPQPLKLLGKYRFLNDPDENVLPNGVKINIKHKH